MNVFPAIDPIPLPAPVWFLKTLHLLLLSLHFTTVHLMIGGLLVATVWNLRRKGPAHDASNALTAIFPVLMTYLINLGVPPLLFAQLLYGVALYTSSILIGTFWISVVFILMALYYILYVMNQRATAGRRWWGFGFLALLLGATIAKIYVFNMTLMIRPEAWAAMYRAAPQGYMPPMGDPTVFPRWIFMMIGAVVMTGIGLVILGRRKVYSESMRAFLTQKGGALTAMFSLFWIAAGWWVFSRQPAAVKEQLSGMIFYQIDGMAWLVIAGLLAPFGFLAWTRKEKAGTFFVVLFALVGVLAEATAVIFRDGIRDVTLLVKGFDVWGQPVYMNLGVIVVFLVVLVVGLGLVSWLSAMVFKAKPVQGVSGEST